MIEDIYGSPMARPLYCSADADNYKPGARPEQWALGYLGTFSEDRQAQLESLLLAPARMLPDEHFVVAGAQYPANLSWPCNVARVEHLPPRQHPSFYCEQRFTLNVTRADMRSLGFSPSVRLFEAAGCGTPVISDRWPGIETIFAPASEILLASTPGEVIQILREMPEETRRAIGDRARKRLLSEHTPEQRARQLEAYYVEALTRRRRVHSDRTPTRLRRPLENRTERA